MFDSIVGVSGFITGIVGIILSYWALRSPKTRLERYLRTPDSWKVITSPKGNVYAYTHKKHPGFKVTIDWDRVVNDGFHEGWVNNSLYPDKTNNCLYSVVIEADSAVIEQELFVSLDGHRYFVPLPRIENINGSRAWFYDKRQVQLAKIIGKFGYFKNINEFADNQKHPITIKK
jgi:hypothetical protein